MATSKSDARTYAGEYQSIFDAVCRAAAGAGMKVVSADPGTGAIRLSSSMSMASWGENLSIQVGQLAAGSIQVSARSALSFGLVDWGKNQKNLDKLFFAIEREVTAPSLPGALPGVVAPGPVTAAPATAAAAAADEGGAGWHADPTGRHEHRYWDGATWSDQVSDAGTVTTDPL